MAKTKAVTHAEEIAALKAMIRTLTRQRNQAEAALAKRRHPLCIPDCAWLKAKEGK